MSKSKKIISIILSIILCFSFVITVSATTPQPRISFIFNIEVVSVPSGTVSSSLIAGHSYLIVTNVTNATYKLGHYSVEPNESITIGTFGNRSAHKGIWYNIEGYINSNATRYSLATAVTGTQLTTLNNVINKNDSWSLIDNCASFAKEVWNSIASTDYEISGGTPTALSKSIRKKSGYITNTTIPIKEKRKIARQTSTSIVYDSTGATAS